ncbi:hypothetical protein AB0J80_32545 [Actinoplanes sp. NPDC049548]|uniref:hypothetical protein n=1 Tax=Actinoplanes sp. NPDC049548 TaxID=3155152 RepID=UPI00341CB83E
MSEPLAATIDSLYATFAPVPRPTAVDYCDCCFTVEEERALLADVPLRQLPADALRPYAANVMFTVGGVDDFRHFLPRLLEIACGEGFSWPDLESVVGRLRFARWDGWPDDQRNAVRDFLTALWNHALTSEPEAEDVDAVLCAIGNAEVDLEPYLTAWTSTLSRPAAAQLRSLLEDGCRSDRTGRRLTNAFWRDRDGQARQVLGWLSSTDLHLALVAAIEVTDSEETLSAILASL